MIHHTTFDYLLGMTEQEAMQAISDAGFGSRIERRDSQPRVVTRDYRRDRINLTIMDGLVTGAHVG